MVEPRPSLLPMPISRMGAWYFWARPDAVGLSAEDAEAIREGVALPEQVDRARVAGQAAMNALIAARGPQQRDSDNMFEAATLIGKPS